jgi:L-rhamnose mutarotase
MPRVAFRLRIRAERIAEYEAAHRRVWPELLRLLKEVGISQYSIFRHGTDLFFYMHVDDFEKAWQQLDAADVNRRWQKEMEPLFESPPERAPGERFPMMREVFYLD